MPSSFTRVLSSALEFSSCPPVSVCGTVEIKLKLSGFSWKLGIGNFAPQGHSLSRLGIDPPDLPKGSSYTLEPGHPTPGLLNLLRPHIAFYFGTGILTRFPSTTHFCLALGADSPCADERCAGNLGLTAREPFTPFIATHVSIRTSDTSSSLLKPPSQAYGTLSYHLYAPLNTLQGCCTATSCRTTNRPMRKASHFAFAMAASDHWGVLRRVAPRINLKRSQRSVQIRDFGAQFEPRYIFRAGRLDQ